MTNYPCRTCFRNELRHWTVEKKWTSVGDAIPDLLSAECLTESIVFRTFCYRNNCSLFFAVSLVTTPSIPKNVILKFQNAKISSLSALKNLIAHQKIARVIVLILMYHTPMLFSSLPSQNHAQRAVNPYQLHKPFQKTMIMASTDAPNAPVTPQEVPRKLSQRDRARGLSRGDDVIMVVICDDVRWRVVGYFCKIGRSCFCKIGHL